MTLQRFQYTKSQKFPGLAGMPFLSLKLTNQTHTVSVRALADSGATVNVLPYDIGLQLGLIWEVQRIPAPLWGTLHDIQAWGVRVIGQVEPFPASPLVFAWTQKTSQEIPVILGQTNFFQIFKVAFDGKVGTFEIILNT
jgi:hypothetical protein